MKPTTFDPKSQEQSPGEEIANCLSHGIGLLAALAASPMLISGAAERGSPGGVIGATIFVVTAALLYLASLLYHALPPSRAKQLFQVLDHGAIFLLIAGTYTPFALGVLRGGTGWILLIVVWSIALFGVVFKAIWGVQYPKFSLNLYLAMGWAGVIVARPLWFLMPAAGLFWLLAGGLAYTVGVPFYALGRFRYSHFVWHLFVLAGTSCHFIAVLYYAG